MNIARNAAVGLAVASSALVAACGGAATVDTASVEKNVKSSIKGPGSVKVATVDCPDDEVAKVGKTFTCPYELEDGSAGEITVTVADEDGTGRWDVSRLASGQAEQIVLTGYEKQSGKGVKQVDCPEPLKAGKDAATVCTYELDSGTRGEVVVTTNGGNMRWETR